MASGLSFTGWLTHFLRTQYEWEWKDRRVYAVVFGVYAIIGLVKACVTLLLTPKCEPDETARREADLADREASAPLLNDGYRRTHRRGASGKATGAVRGLWGGVTTTLSPESRRILMRLCLLFAVNAFASGMLPVTVMSWYANVSLPCAHPVDTDSPALVALSMVRPISSRLCDGGHLARCEYRQLVLCICGATYRARASDGLYAFAQRHLSCFHPVRITKSVSSELAGAGSKRGPGSYRR